MRISDWSSDVCSSDLDGLLAGNMIFDLQWIDEPGLGDLARVTCRESRLDDRPPSSAERETLLRNQASVRRGDLAFRKLESSYGCGMESPCRGWKVVVEGRGVSVRYDCGGGRMIKKK